MIQWLHHTKSDPSVGVSPPKLDGLCEELSDGLSSFIILIDAHHSAWLNHPIPVWKNPQKPWLFPVKPYETTFYLGPFWMAVESWDMMGSCLVNPSTWARLCRQRPARPQRRTSPPWSPGRWSDRCPTWTRSTNLKRSQKWGRKKHHEAVHSDKMHHPLLNGTISPWTTEVLRAIGTSRSCRLWASC